jgi:hypothetical protein
LTDSTDPLLDDGGAPRRPLWRRLWRPVLIVFVFLLVVYYPLGMLWFHKIDDDVAYPLPDNTVPNGASRAVAMAAALIDREVNVNGWVANDPFFKPSSLLDNMPNFQQGIVAALGRFAFELTDQLGRSRGSSQADPDLQNAAGRLQYSGSVWVWDPRTSLLPSATSEQVYRSGHTSLLSYNRRLAEGQAVFERRADNLMATLDRVANDLGSSSAVLERQIAEHSGEFMDFHADDVFYAVKGQVYAYYLVLRELRGDFAGIVRDRDVGTVYDNMLASLRDGAALRPAVVFNARPDSSMMPNHLTAMGFYLLRARVQLREVTNILSK